MNRIVKYAKPSNYDQCEFGTICEVRLDDNESAFYIQTADKDPHWMKVSDYMESLVQNYFKNHIDKEEVLTILSNLFD